MKKSGGVYLIPIYGVWDKVDDIDFNLLPEKFVLKANHGCGYNYLVHEKKQVNVEEIKKVLSGWMAETFGYFTLEPQYIRIQKKLMAEKLEEEVGHKSLTDYKIYCFNGIPRFIHVICGRDEITGEFSTAFYDTNWIKQEFDYIDSHIKKPIQKPKKLEEMLDVAKKLSTDIPFVRVDLYEINNKIKFGEMTFTPYGGHCPWHPKGTNKKLGEMINL